MASLIALDTRLFASEILLRPDHVSAVELQHDGDGGVYLKVGMSGGFVYVSYRFDGGDSGVVANVRAARDRLVDEIRTALHADEPPIQPPAPEKRSL